MFGLMEKLQSLSQDALSLGGTPTPPVILSTSALPPSPPRPAMVNQEVQTDAVKLFAPIQPRQSAPVAPSTSQSTSSSPPLSSTPSPVPETSAPRSPPPASLTDPPERPAKKSKLAPTPAGADAFLQCAHKGDRPPRLIQPKIKDFARPSSREDETGAAAAAAAAGLMRPPLAPLKPAPASTKRESPPRVASLPAREVIPNGHSQQLSSSSSFSDEESSALSSPASSKSPSRSRSRSGSRSQSESRSSSPSSSSSSSSASSSEDEDEGPAPSRTSAASKGKAPKPAHQAEALQPKSRKGGNDRQQVEKNLKRSGQKSSKRQATTTTDPAGDLSFSPSSSPTKMPPSVPTTASSSVTSSSPRKRKASVSDEQRPFAGLDDVQRSAHPRYPRYFSNEKKDKAFPRKPRSLELNWARNSDRRNIFAASCLDGSVQFWSFSQQRQLFSVAGEKLKAKWVEDMCWTRDGDTLALAFPEDTTRQDAPQLGLLRLSTHQGKVKIKIDLQEATPHDGGVNAVAAFKDSQFITAGNDKTLVHWDLTRDQPVTTPFTRKHTSMIQAVMASSRLDVIFSGGADKKLIKWSAAKQVPISERLYHSRVSWIGENPVDPSLLLICLSSPCQQLSLFDTRTPRPIQEFGWAESDSLSRYIEPSWHPSGFLVACGTSAPLINIWDIRFSRFGSEPPFTISAHGNFLFFFDPNLHSLSSLSPSLVANREASSEGRVAPIPHKQARQLLIRWQSSFPLLRRHLTWFHSHAHTYTHTICLHLVKYQPSFPQQKPISAAVVVSND